MLEELQRRRYSPETIRLYLFAVKDFAGYYGKRPDQLSSEHLRQYRLYLLNERKLSVGSVIARTSALRFFFTKVLRRPYREIDLVYPNRPERLPVILSEEEVARLIESGSGDRLLRHLSHVGTEPAFSPFGPLGTRDPGTEALESVGGSGISGGRRRSATC